MKTKVLFLPVLAILLLIVGFTNPTGLSSGITQAADTYVAADSFSWDQYVSVGKDQQVQGPCYLFVSVAQVEAMVRLYFNRPTLKGGNGLSASDPINLSEQQPYSNWAEEIYPIVATPVNERRTNIESTLAFAKYIGLVHDSACPYTPVIEGIYVNYFKNFTPSQIAALRNQIIARIPGYEKVTFSNENQLKRLLIEKGPLTMDLSAYTLHPTGHGYLLAGWKTVNGKTQWEFASDPWPSTPPASEGSFISFQPYFKELNLSIGSAWAVLPVANGNPITYQGLSTANFFDSDGDGYYVWGFGQAKPSECPGYAERDGDDTNPERGPIDSSTLTYKKLAPKQSFEASSWGNTIGQKTVTVLASGTYYWTYYSYKVSGSGYYMMIIYDGKQVAYADEYNMKESGSFPVQQGKTCTIIVKGGAIGIGNFYGRVSVHN